jgi:hypothetical protein
MPAARETWHGKRGRGSDCARWILERALVLLVGYGATPARLCTRRFVPGLIGGTFKTSGSGKSKAVGIPDFVTTMHPT